MYKIILSVRASFVSAEIWSHWLMGDHAGVQTTTLLWPDMSIDLKPFTGQCEVAIVWSKSVDPVSVR